MKKLLTTMLLLTLFTAVKAATKINGIYYNLNDDGTAEVTNACGGDYSCSTQYTGNVTIPSFVTYNSKTYSVTSIGEHAFLGCKSLTSITVPNSVTSIDRSAFNDCTGLTSPVYNSHLFVYMPTSYQGAYTIPDGIKTILGTAFFGCTFLTSITIPSSVASIESQAFEGCTGLTSITIGSGVMSIGENAFFGCKSLTSITIPNSVKNIGEYAFRYCKGLTSVTIGNSVTSIGSYAFEDCTGLTSITIGSGVKSIGDFAFADCTGLTSITIPNSVTSIGGGAFAGCTGLTSIAIPNSVTTIEGGTFRNCTGLTSIAIPNSVTTIEGSTFLNCTGLTSITIPSSVTSIGKRAFEGCTGLTSITIPNSVTSIKPWTFLRCTGLTSVTIGSGVTSIGNGAFYECTGLTNITIPNSVTSIGTDSRLDVSAGYSSLEYNGAFSGCIGLKEITIPESVTCIEVCTFYGCTGLTNVTIENGLTQIGARAFDGCSNLKSIILPATLKRINSHAFEDCTSLETITIPASVESMGEYVFAGCNAKVYMLPTTPPQLINDGGWHEAIGDGNYIVPCDAINAYMSNDAWSTVNTIVAQEQTNAIIGGINYSLNCDGTAAVTSKEEGYTGTVAIPSSVIFESLNYNVTNIGESAFSGCTGLTSVTIPISVTSIGNYAFSGCTNLTQITCTASTPPALGEVVFRNVNNIPLYVPCKSVDAYNAADQWKDLDVKGIEELNLPTLPETNVSKTVCSGTKIAIAGEMRTITEDIDETHTLKSSQQWECYELDSIVHYVIKVYAQPELTVANLSANTLHSGEAIALPQVSVSENDRQAEITDQYWEVKLDNADWTRYEEGTPVFAATAQLRYAIETECGDKVVSDAQTITVNKVVTTATEEQTVCPGTEVTLASGEKHIVNGEEVFIDRYDVNEYNILETTYTFHVYVTPRVTVGKLPKSITAGDVVSLPQVTISDNENQANIVDQYWEIQIDSQDWMRYEEGTPIYALVYAYLRCVVETECGEKISDGRNINVQKVIVKETDEQTVCVGSEVILEGGEKHVVYGEETFVYRYNTDTYAVKEITYIFHVFASPTINVGEIPSSLGAGEAIPLPQVLVNENDGSNSHETQTPEDSFENIEGAINSFFSVGENKKIMFSKGNLQFNAAQGTHKCADGTTQPGTWRFAEHQYDVELENNVNRSATYDGWIDLFTYGASGYNGMVPYRKEVNGAMYAQIGDLTGTYYDFGIYNAISNGGNTPCKWRIITEDDFNYICNIRPNASALRGHAVIGDTYGLILWPDDWHNSELSNLIKFSSNEETLNKYSIASWQVLESMGAVFIPSGEALYQIGYCQAGKDSLFVGAEQDIHHGYYMKPFTPIPNSNLLKSFSISEEMYEEEILNDDNELLVDTIYNNHHSYLTYMSCSTIGLLVRLIKDVTINNHNYLEAPIADQYWEVKLDDADWARYEEGTPIFASTAQLRYALETECSDKVVSEPQTITFNKVVTTVTDEQTVCPGTEVTLASGEKHIVNGEEVLVDNYDVDEYNILETTYMFHVFTLPTLTVGQAASAMTAGEAINLPSAELSDVSLVKDQYWEINLEGDGWIKYYGGAINAHNVQLRYAVEFNNCFDNLYSEPQSIIVNKFVTTATDEQTVCPGTEVTLASGEKHLVNGEEVLVDTYVVDEYYILETTYTFHVFTQPTLTVGQAASEMTADEAIALPQVSVSESNAQAEIADQYWEVKLDDADWTRYEPETPVNAETLQLRYTLETECGDKITSEAQTITVNPAEDDWDPSHPSNPGNYKLTLIAEPEEYGTFEGGGLYEQYSVAEFTAVPNQGYRFTGWADGVEEATRTVVMRRDTAFTAYFEPDEYLITFNNHDGQQLQQSYFQYLTMPVYSGEEPQHQPSDDFAYTFRGWEPELVSVTAEAIYTAAYDSIAYPDTVIISDTRNLSEMFIGPKTHVITTETAVVSIPEPVKVKSLTLWVSGADSPDIDGIENLTAEVVDMVLRLEPYEDTAVKSKWYAFAVPFNVSVAEGIRPENDPYHARLGRDFVLDEYDGELRATTQQGWKRVLEGATLLPGHTYMIAVNGTDNFWRLTMLGTTPITEQTSVAVNAYPSPIREHHSGWNGISNIRWQTAYAELEGVRYATIYHNDLSVYEVVRTDEQALHAFCPFFVQTSADGTVNFIETGASMMPRRRGAEQDNNNVSLTISLKKLGSSYADKAYLTTSADKPNHYVIGSDLEKMLNSSATVPQLWLEAYGMKLSAHEALLTEHSVSVPLGIYAPEAGDYIISVSGSTANAQILLIYNGSVIWDLTLGQCQLPLHAGNNEGYSIVVKVSDEVVTGIENQESRANSQAPVKFIKDGIIYIQLPDGTLFNANGKLVK